MEIVVKRKIKDTSLDDDAIVKMLLHDRGIENVDEFLSPVHPREITTESLFTKSDHYEANLKKLLDLLKSVKKDNRKVVVYTDYDADGITGGAILWETLHILGFQAMPYVPDRKNEGYGFSKKGIDRVQQEYDPGLIISVDHGIMGHESIAYARELGIPIVVTDHHQRGDTDPSAAAIFHTTRVSGAGVAYFVAREIAAHINVPDQVKKKLQYKFENEYLGLASIGIVADLVPLTGVARSVVKHGLTVLSDTKNIGLQHIMKESGILDRPITTYEIGYIIAPRINAFGRVGSPLDALRLLCTPVPTRAHDLAKKAGAMNTLRQNLLRESYQEALQMVDETKKIIVVHASHWEEGIVGLIASKLVGKFHKPAIVTTASLDTTKGSARSIEGFDITSFLKKLKKNLLQVGGHTQAAGFTVKPGAQEAFASQVEEAAESALSSEDLLQRTYADASIPMTLLSSQLVHKLEALQPFGIGNTQPLFLSRGRIAKMFVLGKQKDHLKTHIIDEQDRPLECIFFGKGHLAGQLSINQEVDVVYSIGLNTYNGRTTLQGIGKILQ